MPDMQTWYRATVRLEVIGKEATTLQSRGRDSTIEHWFDGGWRHDLFLRPSDEREQVHLRPGEPVLLSALIQCFTELTISQDTKWLSQQSNHGTIARGEVVAVHEVWQDGKGTNLSFDGDWAGHCLF